MITFNDNSDYNCEVLNKQANFFWYAFRADTEGQKKKIIE